MIKKSTSTITDLKSATRLISGLVLLMLCMTSLTVKAQVPYNEGFEIIGPYPQGSLPYGWTQGKFGAGVDPDNQWEIMNNTATGPATAPRTGFGMARYNSEVTLVNEKAYLSTKKLDMTLMPGTGASGSFWMYRGNAGVAAFDSINVYANTVPDMTGTPIKISTVVNIPQYCGAAPASTCNAWYQVFFTIPGALPYQGSNSVYVSILGRSGDGQNIYVDDFTVNTYPAPQSFISSAVVNQITATTQPNLPNQQIIGLRITVANAGVPLLSIQDMIWNTNGCDNATADIVNAKLWFTGGTPTFDLTTATLLGTVANPWFTNYTFLAGTPWSGLENGDNYFWITYDITPGASTGNYVDAECVSFNKSSVPNLVTPVPQTINGRRLIDVVYCIPTYTVGTSWLSGSYTNNDYVRSVTLAGDVAPGINNIYNTNGPTSPSCPGYPSPSQCGFSAHPPDYEYFPPTNNHTAILTQGNSYPMTVGCGTWYSSNYIAAFIDFNRDGDFFDANEKVLQSGNMGALTTYTTSFTVPLTAIAGNTRLRVREVYATSNIQPCDHRTYGESEDYVVTIVPTCAPAWPGWKTWLGFTNDWDNPANWCGGVPSSADNARIPGKGAGPNDRPGDFAPKIKAGVIATAKNLRIETNDTVFVDAPAGSSLSVDSTLLILDNTSALIINSTFSDSARVLNGTLAWPFVGATNNPLKGNVAKVRNIWIYEQSELLGEGMIAGDIVTNILMHVTRNATNNEPFRNLTVKMYYTDAVNPIPTGFRFNLPGKLPPVIGPAPVTIFGPQDVSTSTFIPVSGNNGTIDLSLIPGAFVWDGSANKVVIDMSYDNQGFAVPNNSDLPLYTQTLGLQHFISIYGSRDNFTYPANTLTPTSNIGVGAAGITAATVGGNTFNLAGGVLGQAAVGQQLQGAGMSFNVAGCAFTTGSNVITIGAGVPATVQVGHYITGGGFNNSPQVTAILSATTIQVSTPSTANGSTTLTFRPAITSIVGNTVTLSANIVSIVAGSISFGSANSSPSTGSDYRPNLTFKFDRPYNRYPITVRRDWVNNGTFVPAFSEVLVRNSIWGGGNAIGGSSVSTFFDLRIANPAHVRMDQDAIVTDTLTLQIGRLKLNNRLMTVTNPDPIAIRRISGAFQSDADILGTDIAPFGRVRWQMGSTPGIRVIPFENFSGVYVPLDYSVDNGTHDVTFATYSTPDNNQNIPLPIVTNILGQVSPGAYNTTGEGMVDRYYMIDNSLGSAGAQADITFRYASTEDAQYLPGGTMRAQRWLNSSSLWEQPFLPSQSNTPGSRVVSLTDYNLFNQNVWWTIVGQTTPLPVELLNFSATQFKDRVRLDWITATEINNSHFVVERSIDNNDFSFIDRVDSKGPASGNLNYRTWDLNPVEGIQYYYLRQYDRDGRFESFGPVSAKFSSDQFDIVTATISSANNGLTVVFDYNTNEPFSYRIVDMTGRLIVAKDRNPGTPGVNVIDIDATLARGAYQIILQNSEKIVTRKFFY